MPPAAGNPVDLAFPPPALADLVGLAAAALAGQSPAEREQGPPVWSPAAVEIGCWLASLDGPDVQPGFSAFVRACKLNDVAALTAVVQQYLG